MGIKYSNNANTTLSSGINDSVTSAAVASGAVFPALSGGDYFYATIETASQDAREIVKVTARSGNTLTIVRAQDNTSAAAFSSGDNIELRVTAAVLEDATEPTTGITAGTVIASKAIITDSNKDITGGRNITISGALDTASLETDTLSIASTAVTSTAAELNILDGVTSTTAELNILDGVTSTTAELNILDGVTSTAAELNILDGVTSTAAELNILNGVTSTTAELNILDGVTSTAAELNILDGVTSTAAELNILDGATVVVGEINALDLGATAIGTAIASKAVILDANKDYTGIRNLTATGTIESPAITLGGTALGSLYSPIAGSASITTVGTVGTGTWQGTAVADTYVANDLTISGGTVNSSVIGGTTAAAGTFTTLSATGNVTLGDAVGDSVTFNAGTATIPNNLTFSGTGTVKMPIGTTAQRPTGAVGMFRYNTTLSQFEGYTDAWGSIGGGASAGGAIYENTDDITANYTITSGSNGMSVGPITVASGVAVTIPSGSRWVIL